MTFAKTEFGAGTKPRRAEAAVEELLLQVELAKCSEERVRLQGELDGFVAANPHAALVYRTHLELEEHLEMLTLEAFLSIEPSVSPVRNFFRRLRMRFFPGPMG